MWCVDNVPKTVLFREMPSEIEVKFELNFAPATPELLKWAQENINEDPNTVCQVVEEFRDMIFSRGECTPHRTDDAFLLRFLRSRKFNLESCYRLLCNYCDFRDERLHYIEGECFDLLARAGENDFISVPPYRDQMGRRLLMYKVGNWIPEKFSVDEIGTASFLILELAILEQSAQILGGIWFIDCENLTMNHALYVTPNVIKKFLQVAVLAQVHRIEAIHIVNNSWICEILFNIVKPFLNDKMKERMFFHGTDMESLHRHISPECLPIRYGGVYPDHSYVEWLKFFRSSKHVINEMSSLGYTTM